MFKKNHLCFKDVFHVVSAATPQQLLQEFGFVMFSHSQVYLLGFRSVPDTRFNNLHHNTSAFLNL